MKNITSAPDAVDQDREQPSYHPSLSRIREEKERGKDTEPASSRSHSRSRSHERQRERTPRRVVPSEDIGLNSGHVYRRGVRHRSGQSVQLQRQLTSIANASVLSVLSSLTAASGASSGSNSTITQSRYDRSHGYRKRRKRSSQRDSEGEESSGSRHQSTSARRTRPITEQMEEGHVDGDGPAHGISYSPSQWQPHYRSHSSMGYQEPLPARGPSRATSSRADSVTRMDRTNSDSGISMRDTSPEAVEKLPKSSPLTRHDSVLEVDVEEESPSQRDKDGSDSSEEEEEAEEEQPAIDVSQFQVASYDEDRHLRELMNDRQDEASSHILQSPQPRRYHSFTRPRYDVQPGVQHMPYQDAQQPPAYAPRRTSMAGSQMFAAHPPYGYQQRPTPSINSYIEEEPSQETAIGYELLAKKLAEHTAPDSELDQGKSFAPLYRRFDFLNHRVLLHLQDEIAELEEELRRTDEMIARHQGQCQAHQVEANGGTVPQRVPTSRREEVSSGDELCERRSHILGRIYTRLEQYNKALASYRSATTGFATATTEQIEQYQAWMTQNKPVDEVESKFLNSKQDLMALRPQVADARPTSAPANVLPVVTEPRLPHNTYTLAALTFVPMALFAFAPDVYSKAFIALGTVALSAFLSSYGLAPPASVSSSANMSAQ